MDNETTIVLYLAPWQKRLIKDYMKAHAKRIGLVDPYLNLAKLAFRPKDHSLVTYRVPDPGLALEGAFNLYLTDEQIVQLTECTGLKTKFTAIQITPQMLKEKIVAFS